MSGKTVTTVTTVTALYEAISSARHFHGARDFSRGGPRAESTRSAFAADRQGSAGVPSAAVAGHRPHPRHGRPQRTGLDTQCVGFLVCCLSGGTPGSAGVFEGECLADLWAELQG